MDYVEWEKEVPEEIKADSLWKVTAYRLALFVADLGWLDVTKLMKDRRTISLSDQLYRALGSIGANISEGYSRGTGKDRARFYEYALGSAREARGWYFDGRHILGQSIVDHRIRLITEIIKLLLTMIPQQRSYAVHDEIVEYGDVSQADRMDDVGDLIIDNDLLKNVPIPSPD
jgi:four helix bundle protein